MSLQNKFAWLLVGLLAFMGVALVSNGYWIINKVILQHFEQQFSRELINLKLEIDQAYKTLERAGVTEIASYVKGAQDKIIRKFESYHFGESGYLYILDGQGKVVYHPDLKSGISEPLGLYPEIQADTNESLFFDYQDKNMFGIYTHADTWDWTIVLVINEQEMFARRDAYLIYVAIIVTLSLLITLVILRWLFQRVAQRIANTVNTLKVMESGDFSARFIHFENDEIGVIQHGVNSLIEQIEVEISRRRDTEHQLLKAKESADSANKAKSQFLANMSHEIRTPMNGVIGMTGLLLESDLSKEQQYSLETIRESGNALLTIIDDILDFSKFESGQLHLEKKWFSLNELLRGILDILSTQVKNDEVTFRLDLQELVEDSFIGDAGRIRQIIMNLVGNALKFTEQGEVILKINITDARNNGAHLHFDIIDSGIGIAEEDIGRLLERFVQADSSITSKYGGTGLGLSICKSLVEQMGGEMGVESTLGEGSRFWFNLNLDRCRRIDTDNIGVAGNAKSDPENQSVVLNILLVEDIEINQVIAKKLIEKNGHIVDIANNGIEAIEAVKNTPYDLIFMDVRMPEMDGLTATKAIRKLKSSVRNTPIFAMTANATTSDVKDCYDAGMNNFVAKPIDSKLLKHTLKEFVESVSKQESRSTPADGIQKSAKIGTV